jgi:hypothetical protein
MRAGITKRLLAALAIGSVLGGGAAGIRGIANWNSQIPKSVPPETDVELPYPQTKQAFMRPDEAGGYTATDPNRVGLFEKDFWKGRGASSPWGHPLFLPTAAGTLAGSALLSSALVNKLFKMKQQRDLDKQLAGSEQDFNKAILGEYKPEKLHELKKSAAIDKALQNLYIQLEKTADPVLSEQGSNRIGFGTGAAITGSALLALLAAKGGYELAHGKSDEYNTEKALKYRSLLKSLQGPPAISAHPVGVPIQKDEEPVPVIQ